MGIMDGLIFVGNTPDFLADPLVFKRFCKGIPHGRKARKIIWENQKRSSPLSLVFAIYSIETSFRPCWVRVFEVAYLFVFTIRWLLTGMGFRDITVGTFQIGCHIVGDYTRAEYKRKGNYWYPKRSLKLAKAILSLPCFWFNVKVAMARIEQLWEEAMTLGYRFEDAVIYVGAWYNGNESYGRALLRIIYAINDSTPKTPYPWRGGSQL